MFKLDAVIADIPALVPPKHVGGPPIARGVWERALGTRIARRAEPVRLHKGVLLVRVASSAWANELALLTCDILTQLNEQGVEATALRFMVGPLETPQPKRDPPKTSAPLHARIPEDLEPHMAAIADDDLRAALTDAAAKHLAIKKV